jgi:hypothetical protein
MGTVATTYTSLLSQWPLKVCQLSGPSITVPWEDANTFMFALASLPSLEKVNMGCFHYEGLPPVGEFPGLTNLMKSQSLRSINFSELPFTSRLSRTLLAAVE